MTVVCPNCNSSNKDESRFCSACGHELRPHAAGRCSQCGAQNPTNNIFCDECGSRLVASSPDLEAKSSSDSLVRGLSLPQKESATDKDAPDWLSQLRSTLPEDEEASSEEIPPPTPTPADEGPAWLDEIVESSKPSDADIQSTDTAGLSTTSTEDLPDWLQDALEKPSVESEPLPAEPEILIGSNEVQPADSPTPETTDNAELEGLAPGELPDWLQVAAVSDEESAASDEDQVSPGEDSPAWFQDLQQDQPGESAEESALEPGEIPDWLQATVVSEPEPELEEPTLPDTEQPDWLQESPAAPMAEPEIETGESLDWLQASAPETEPESPQRPELPEVKAGDLPDWLQGVTVSDVDLPDTPPAEETGVQDIQPGELPDWIQSAETSPVDQASPEPVSDDQDEVQAGQIPDWMDALAVESESQDQVEETAGELPDWLQEFTSPTDLSDDESLAPPAPLIPSEEPDQVASAEKPTTSPLMAENLKDWLGETTGADDEEEDPSKAATQRLRGTGPLVPPELPDWLAAVEDTPSSSETLPDWLITEEEAQAPLVDIPSMMDEDGDSLPDWLADDEEPEPSLPASDTSELVPGTLPDWLQPPDQAQTELQPAQLPDWLVPPEQLDQIEPAEDSPLSDLPAWPDDEPPAVEGLAQAVIPDWLQALKPTEDVSISEAEAEPETVESAGPLQGVRGAIAIEGAVVSSPASRPLPKFVVTERQQAHIQVLQQIIHGGPAPKPKLDSTRTAQWWLERGVIPILILLAVLLPIGLDLQLFAPAESIINTEINDTYWLLESLPENAPVVVAFDYTPAEAGEIESVAAPLLHHLMDHRLKIVAVSTVPGGPQLAQNLMDRIAEDYNYLYEADYVNLGYIPGDAMGLKSFAHRPWDTFPKTDFTGKVSMARYAPAAAGILNSLQDAELVLILTAQRNNMVNWIEQVGQLPEMQNVPLAAGVSAGLAPWIRPYLNNETTQLKGLVAGVFDAAQYEQQAKQSDLANITQLRDGQMLGLMLIILFIVIGLVWGSVVGLTKRRPSHG